MDLMKKHKLTKIQNLNLNVKNWLYTFLKTLCNKNEVFHKHLGIKTKIAFRENAILPQ